MACVLARLKNYILVAFLRSILEIAPEAKITVLRIRTVRHQDTRDSKIQFVSWITKCFSRMDTLGTTLLNPVRDCEITKYDQKFEMLATNTI